MWRLSLTVALGIALAALGHRSRRQQKLRRGLAEFHRAPLASALGAGQTEARRVRLWGRSPSAGRHELVILELASRRMLTRVEINVSAEAASDGVWAVQYPDDFAAAPPLEPLTRYEFSVKSLETQRSLGAGRFETAPLGSDDTPDRFAFAAVSCHLPFDDDGRSSTRACQLLELLPEVFERHGVKRIIMMGDQIYGDYPPRCSLFDPAYFRRVAPRGRERLLDCTREEVRQLYQERHRIFWKHEGFQRIQSRFACHMMLDDHEIVDNFATAPEHSTPRYANLRLGALDAFYDYQAARELPLESGARPRAFYHGFEYGSVAAFIMDLRSERKASEAQVEVCSEAQWQALEAFLADNGDKQALFLVLSVPLLHVPDWLATVGVALGEADGDVDDRWMNPRMEACRERLLSLLHEHQKAHPRQKLVLLGGDVHVGAVSRLSWSDGVPDSYQLISSAVTNRVGFMLRSLADLVPKIGAVVGRGGGAEFQGKLLEVGPNHACEGDPCNPYVHLNAGIVEVQRISATESSVRLLLVGHDGGSTPKAKIVFDSGPL